MLLSVTEYAQTFLFSILFLFLLLLRVLSYGTLACPVGYEDKYSTNASDRVQLKYTQEYSFFFYPTSDVDKRHSLV